VPWTQLATRGDLRRESYGSQLSVDLTETLVAPALKRRRQRYLDVHGTVEDAQAVVG
jgi:hypothetical protein